MLIVEQPTLEDKGPLAIEEVSVRKVTADSESASYFTFGCVFLATISLWVEMWLLAATDYKSNLET